MFSAIDEAETKEAGSDVPDAVVPGSGSLSFFAIVVVLVGIIVAALVWSCGTTNASNTWREGAVCSMVQSKSEYLQRGWYWSRPVAIDEINKNSQLVDRAALASEPLPLHVSLSESDPRTTTGEKYIFSISKENSSQSSQNGIATEIRPRSLILKQFTTKYAVRPVKQIVQVPINIAVLTWRSFVKALEASRDEEYNY